MADYLLPDAAPPSYPPRINLDLDSLRGFAAIFVVWHHISVFGYMLDPGYRQNYPLAYGPSGHFCVLIFFVLSGYVIGLNYAKPLTWASSKQYLKKRLVRLYPIFLFCLLLTLAVTPHSYTAATIAGNLLMVQGLVVPDANPPSWSLHYEMLYYLVFIGISAFRIRPLVVVGLALVVGLANYVLYPVLHTAIITSYCYGLTFWVLGVFMSQRLRHIAPNKVPYRVMVSCLFFVLCVDQYNLLNTVLRQFVHVGFPADLRWDSVAIELYDLSAVPIALAIVLVFAGKRVPYLLPGLGVLFLGLALPKLLYVAIHARSGDLNWGLYGPPTIFLSASFLCLFVRSAWLEQVCRSVVRAGTKAGALSYAIYLLHFPLLYLFSHITFFSGSSVTFAARIVLLLGITVVVSYWLEKVMQPWLKAWFFPPRPAPVPQEERLLAELPSKHTS